MWKRIVGERPETIDKPDGWMNVEALATVEVTSETPEFPIEGAVPCMAKRDGTRLNLVSKQFGCCSMIP